MSFAQSRRVQILKLILADKLDEKDKQTARNAAEFFKRFDLAVEEDILSKSTKTIVKCGEFFFDLLDKTSE